MARESTTVQCYPSDSVINKKVQRYEAFGCLTIALTIAVTRIVRKICYGRNIAKWHAEHDPAIRELEDRAEKLRKKSLALING